MIVLILIIVVLLVIFIVANYFYNYAFTRTGVEKNVEKLASSDGMPNFDDFRSAIDHEWWSKHSARRITINSFDGLKLSALYVKNEADTNKIVIFSHGYSATAASMVLYAPTYYELE